MANLTPEQRRIARTILQVGQQMGAGPKALKAAIATGLVESNLRNVNHGDRDSLGVFQQRPSQGWGSPEQVRDVEYAAKQFFKRAIPQSKKYGSAGQLAQAVQRSAFPERYDQRGDEAETIISSLLGGSSGGAKGGGSVQSGTPGSVQVTPGEGYSPDMAPGGTGVADLIAALAQKPQQAGSVGIESPEFSSTQYLATSGPTPVGGGGPVQHPQLDVMALLDAVGRGPDISGQVDGPSVSVTPGSGGSAPNPSPSSGGSSKSGGHLPGLKGKGSGLKELFYDPQGGWDNGKSIGAIGGHSDHIHVAAGPNTLKAVAELARKKGLHISDFEPYDKVDPVHTNGSFHYSGRAADLSGSPKQMAQFTRLLRDYFGLS